MKFFSSIGSMTNDAQNNAGRTRGLGSPTNNAPRNRNKDSHPSMEML